jgi:large subunit ribosomal protein L4
MILGALKSALSAKLRDGELKVVDAFAFAEHKTRVVRQALNALEATKTALLVDAGENVNLARGSQNLEGVKLVGPKGVTAYDLLKHKLVLISKEAAEKLSVSLAGGAK